MANTYTTNFENIQDGSQTSYTPQDLVQKSGQIQVTDAEAQWRGVSTTSTSTNSQTKQNSDSAQASIETVTDTNTNRDSGTTTGTTDVQTTTKTVSNSGSGQYGNNSGGISVDTPDLPQPSSSDTTIEPQQIEVDYFVDEDTGGSDTNIVVEWDDDPYNAANYDSETTLNISDLEKKRVGGFSKSIVDKKEYNRFDGAQIRFVKTGDTFGTSGLVAEITVTYEVRTTEQTLNREQIRVEYPPRRSGYTFDVHVIKTFIDGELDNTERSYTYSPTQILYRKSPPQNNSTKEIVIETRSQKRETQFDTAITDYPSTPSGYSVQQYTIEEFEDNSLVDTRTVQTDKDGESETITSTNPSTSVTLTITGKFIETVSNTQNTVNPRLSGDYLPDGLNTDNVVFLMDTSGSADQTRQQDIARRILSQLTDNSNAALLEFDFNTTTVVGLESLSTSRQSIIDGINSLGDSGGTDIGQALLEANSAFDGSDGTIVIISDGESSDDPTSKAQTVASDGRQILSVKVGSGDEPLMRELATITNGEFFDNNITVTTLGTNLSDGELSEWKQLSDFDRTTQVLDHLIDGSGLAEFRIRFTWVYKSAKPVNGSVAFRDNSAGVWREVAVADESDDLLQYTHISVYNDTTNEWGVLDVVDVTHEAAIESHQFYDEDVGWLAPREYQTA